MTHIRDVTVPKDWDRRGLPGWSYHSPAFLELEKEHLFRKHWQIAGHISDVPAPGDYLTMDAMGERALVVHGRDGIVRGFHNICRHRGSRVVAAEKGTCKNALVCPFHGWVYNLDGTLRGASRPRSFPELDKTEFGLIPLDLEIWMGLIFVRFRKGPQPAVAELMKPFEDEIANYRIADMVPTTGIHTQTSPVNWKSVRDVDNEGYHVAMAHPALQDLYGSTYFDEPFVDGLSRSFATYNPHAGRRWSVKNYVRIAPEAVHLPEELRKAWVYYGMFPNTVIAATPEIRPVLPGVSDLDGPNHASRRDISLQGRKPGTCRREISCEAHRPRHSSRGCPAHYLVERVDAVEGLCWLLPIRSRIWRADLSRSFAPGAACAGA